MQKVVPERHLTTACLKSSQRTYYISVFILINNFVKSDTVVIGMP